MTQLSQLQRIYLATKQTLDHPANRGHRLKALRRGLAFQARGRLLKRRTLTPLGERSRMWAEVGYIASSNVVYANPPDWNEMHAWRRLIRPGNLFVDVGANLGAYSIVAGEMGANVIAIEPTPGVAKRLRENMALNGYPVDVVEAALAEKPGKMRMRMGADDVRNHLLAEGDAGGTEVTVSTLDAILGSRRAHGLKIDVEGAEELVLRGGTAALSEGRIDAIQMEWTGLSERVLGRTREPIVAMLRDYGYRFVRPDEQGLLHDAVDVLDGSVDMFAVRE